MDFSQKLLDNLPIPTGPYQVGLARFDLEDPNRKEIHSPKGRLIPAHIYFPTKKGPHLQHGKIFEKRSPESTFSPKVKIFSQEIGLSFLAEGLNPLIFLNHANTVCMTDYGFIAEDLASHGYVVITLQHQLNTDPIEPAFWDDRSFSLHARVIDNILFAYQWLKEIHQKTFSGHIDLNRVGFIGHSMGGNALLLFANRMSNILKKSNSLLAHDDEEAKECLIVLDTGGYPFPLTNHLPLFFLFSEERIHQQMKSGRYKEIEKAGHKIRTYKGSKHISFMDHGYVNPPNPFPPHDSYFNGTIEERLTFFNEVRCDIRNFLENHLLIK